MSVAQRYFEEYQLVLPLEEAIEWTDEDVFKLREGMLYGALSALADHRTARQSVKEALAWVLSTEKHPFSFCVCAEMLGFCADELRDLILEQQQYAA